MMNSEIARVDAKPVRMDILVMEGASMLTLAGAGDPLRAANRITGRAVFDWRYVSVDGAGVRTSAGNVWPVGGRLDPGESRDFLFVVAGFGTPHMRDRHVVSAIYRASRNARFVYGIESGAWLLARAGLLDGRQATTHWEDFEDFAAAFPAVDLKPDRAVADGRIVTTSGAGPTYDAMIDLIRRTCGQAAALDVAGAFLHEAFHSAADLQNAIPLGPPGNRDARVGEAIRAMEARLDEPVTIAAIARRLSMSVRGIEKLFAKEIGETPGAYYLSLRLNSARRLLLDTRLPLSDIATRTGFSSLAAFSRAFKRGFGRSPRMFRNSAGGPVPG
jgi:transcriptional regulator GlxA family with amidase domain